MERGDDRRALAPVVGGESAAGCGEEAVMGSGEPAAGWEERMEVMRFGLGVESTLIGASSWLAVGVVVFKEFPTIPVSLPAMCPAEAGLVPVDSADTAAASGTWSATEVAGAPPCLEAPWSEAALACLVLLSAFASAFLISAAWFLICDARRLNTACAAVSASSSSSSRGTLRPGRSHQKLRPF